MAPEEMLLDENINEKVDIWAVGIILFKLLTDIDADFQHKDFDKIIEEIEKNKKCSDLTEAKDFLRKLLDKKREDRYTAAEALESDWLKDDI